MWTDMYDDDKNPGNGKKKIHSWAANGDIPKYTLMSLYL